MHRSEAVFLGREREMEALTAAVEQARRGRGSLFLLSGEPGIGKTRLADAVAAVAADRGIECAWGRAWEAGGAPAYWPWIEVLRSLARRASGPRTAEAPLLSRNLEAASTTDAAQARFQLFDEVAAFVRDTTSAEPLVVILDDLHVSDHPSLLLLQFLARQLRSLPVLLIGTYRDAEARLQPELAEVLARIAREGTCFALRRLQREEVADFVRLATGIEAAAGAIESLHRATEGNPLFVDEMLRLVVVQGGLDRFDRGSPLPIPDGVREAIRERLGYLSTQARAPLEIASILGRESSLAIVAETAGLSIDRLRDHLAGAVSARILVELDGGRVAFSHILMREVLYRDLPAVRRAELHQQVARALESRAADGQPPLAELAHHYFEAASVGETERAIDYAKRAAERAMGLLAYEEAAHLLERALTLLDRAPPDGHQRAELLLLWARALFRAGDGKRARECCVRAAELARAAQDTELLARAALGYGEEFVIALVDPVLVGLLEESLARLPMEDNALRARAMARLGAALQPAVDFRTPMRMAHDAIAMARHLGDPATLLSVLHAACGALADFEDPKVRAPLDRELVERATAAGDKVLALRGRSRLIFDLVDSGELAAADLEIDQFESLASVFSQPKYRWQAPMFRAMRALMAGRFGQAATFAAEGEAIARESQDRGAGWTMDWHALGSARVRERSDEYDAFEPRIRAMCREIGFEQVATVVRASMLARRGDLVGAAAALEGLPPDLYPHDDMSALAAVCEGVAAVGDAGRARFLYDRLLPHAGRIVCWGLAGIVTEGPVTRVLGILACAQSRWDEMDGHFEDAAKRSAALGLRPHLARVCLEWAQGRLRAGRPGDAEKSRPLLERALEVARELDLRDLLVQLEPLVGSGDRSPATTSAPATPPSPPFRMELEGELWSITCEGSVFRLKDSRGLQILSQLVQHPDRDFHVIELSSSGAADAGDAGEVLDREAIAAYRERLVELDEAIAQAERMADSGRLAQARAEKEFLTDELARGMGLGGRARKAASSVERARVNVQRRVRDAIRRIAEQSPNLGRHLDWAIRTGAFCSYRASS